LESRHARIDELNDSLDEVSQAIICHPSTLAGKWTRSSDSSQLHPYGGDTDAGGL